MSYHRIWYGGWWWVSSLLLCKSVSAAFLKEHVFLLASSIDFYQSDFHVTCFAESSFINPCWRGWRLKVHHCFFFPPLLCIFLCWWLNCHLCKFTWNVSHMCSLIIKVSLFVSAIIKLCGYLKNCSVTGADLQGGKTDEITSYSPLPPKCKNFCNIFC